MTAALLVARPSLEGVGEAARRGKLRLSKLQLAKDEVEDLLRCSLAASGGEREGSSSIFISSSRPCSRDFVLEAAAGPVALDAYSADPPFETTDSTQVPPS